MTFEEEVLQRITRLESGVEEQGKDIQEIKEKLNGYLERRIKTTIKAFLGEIVLVVVTSSAFIAFLISKFLK